LSDVEKPGSPDSAPGKDSRLADIATWLAQGLSWHRKGNLIEAQALYQRVLDHRPKHPEALNYMGILQQQRGQSGRAEQLIRQAILSAPGYAAAYANLGNVLLVQRRYEDAITAYRQAILLGPDEVEACVNLGAVLRGLGRLPEALEAYRQAKARRPLDVEIRLRLGTILAELEQTGEAVAVLEEALRDNPTHEEVAKQLGTLLHRLGRVEDARVVFGNAVFQLGDDKSALTLLQHWLRLMPDDRIAQHRLAAWLGQDEIPVRASDAYVTYLFDHYADQFDSHLLEQLNYRAPAVIVAQIAEILEVPAARLDILDAGCGTGLCAPLLRPYARHLTGVDLSPRMLDKARERGGYDELVVAELTAFLAGQQSAYDLIVSADTLVYFGALDAVLHAVTAALRPGGWLAFTAEALVDTAPPAGFRLNPSGRYSHTAEYLDRSLKAAGLEVRTITEATLRLENDQPMVGYVVLARRPIPT